MLLYHARLETVDRLIESGRVRPRGSKNRVRALVAVCGDVGAELLPLAKPKRGTYFSFKGETPSNPRGVWAHRDSRRFLMADETYAA